MELPLLFFGKVMLLSRGNAAATALWAKNHKFVSEGFTMCTTQSTLYPYPPVTRRQQCPSFQTQLVFK